MPLQQLTSPIEHGDVPGGRHLSADLGIITIFESGMFLVLLLAISPTPSEVSGISLHRENARRNGRHEEKGHYQNQTYFLAIHLISLALAHNRKCDDFYARQIDKGTQLNNAILQPPFKWCPPLVTITSGPQ
ncbi:hypothetical protein NC652_013434 [Populus alba x Populus x berolinensis]|nr:hypothetical protein NC652_013434 [Populus alba x Populus x berolinensis]